MLLCSSFLITVSIFIVSKALLISSATVIVHARIWLHLFAMVLLNVCSAITERSSMCLYEVPLCMSLLGFGIGTMFANLHMCGIMLSLRAVLIIIIIYNICIAPYNTIL